MLRKSAVEPGEVQPVCDALRLAVQRRVALQHEGIMTRHNAPRRARQRFEPDVAVQDIGDVDGDGKYFTLLEVLVVVRAVGGEHHGSAGRHYANALQPSTVPAN